MKKNPWVVPFVAGSRGDRYAHLERRALSQYIHGDSVTARAEFLKARMQEVFLCGVQVSSVLDHLLAIGEAHAQNYYGSVHEIVGALYRNDPWGSATNPAVMLTGLAGTGKTQLLRAMRRLLLERVGHADLPRHKNLVIHPAWFMSLRDGSTLNALLRPCLMSDEEGSGGVEMRRQKDVKQSHLLGLARRVSRRDGVCIICLDEFQFITRSLQANTLAMALLLQLLSIGPRLVYVANFSLARRLMSRRQEDRHRVLANHLELLPDVADGADFMNYVRELLLIAPSDFQFEAPEITPLVHRYSFGIKRAVVELLVGAWTQCKSRRGGKADVTESDLKAAYASSGYLPFRSDVEALWRHSVGDENIEPDLVNPLGVPSPTENVVVAQAAIDSFNRRANELHIENMLTPRQLEALNKLRPQDKDVLGSQKVRRLPMKAASKESLLDTFARIGRES